MSAGELKDAQMSMERKSVQAVPTSIQDRYQHLIGHLNHVLRQSPLPEVSPNHLDELVYLSQVLNDVSPTLMVLRQLRAQRAA